jgi:predicted Fe-S protein YdhL (DUF1289 family)|tara:strand:- start:1333 stop:1572 length:240 start_codon:yes stop_codon:yes gene_type:complete
MAKAKYSPCIKICTYDDEGYCMGCQRTADEVTGWRDRTEEEQLAGMEILRDRKIYRASEQVPIDWVCNLYFNEVSDNDI